MKVYLLTEGSYSDESVVGIFSNLENAKRIYDEYRRLEHGEINDPREYELDELISPQAGPVFTVYMSLKNGEVISQCENPPSIRDPHGCDVDIFAYGSDHRIVVKSPVSAEHAMKVAVEQRQEWLRSRSIAPRPEDRA